MKRGDLESDGLLFVLLVIAGLVGAAIISNEFSENTAAYVVDVAIQKLNVQFYKETLEGNYNIRTYKWALSGLEQPLDKIPKDTNLTVPNSAVLFNGRFPINLRAVGIRVFERTDKTVPYNVKVAAVFLGNCSSIAPEWGVHDSNFNMSFYDYKNQKNKLERCSVYDREYSITRGGASYTIFYIHCSVLWQD
ncbi:MAG: hypothetical protein QW590_00045 [Candidatus Bilamarchaeaceae archaeon]